MAVRTRSSSQQAALQADLLAAAAAGDVSTVQLLLHRGASANGVAGSTSAPLHEAAAAGRGRVVRVLLAAGADGNALHEGATALALAARAGSGRGCAGVIKQLVRAGATLDISFSDRPSSTVLHAVAAEGWLHALQALLDAGCQPDLWDQQNHRPLWYAVEQCQVAAAAKLIRAGAALNDCYAQPASSPLAHAALTGCEPMVQLLIRKGADTPWAIYCLALAQAAAEAAAAQSGEQLITPGAQGSAAGSTTQKVARAAAALALLLQVVGINVTGLGGYTALHIAVSWVEPGALEVLLRHGAAVDAVVDGPVACTALDLAAKTAAEGRMAGAAGAARHRACAAMLRQLLAAGAAATAQAAICVAVAGLEDVLRLMLSQGVDVSTQPSTVLTVLHAAIAGDMSSDTVRQLLAAGADAAAAATNAGLTPLHFAAWRGRADCAQLLLEAGADVHARGTGAADCTPMHTVTLYNIIELNKPCPPVPPLRSPPVLLTVQQRQAQQAAVQALKSTVQVLLDHGADINALNDQQRTPLQAAIGMRNAPAVQALLELGADPYTTTEPAYTPGLLAVLTGQAEVLRLLLQPNVPVNQLYGSTGEETTLLVLAVRVKSPALVEVLLQFGADVDTAPPGMELPLSTAIRLKQHDIIQQRLAAGAKIHARPAYGPCPMSAAVCSGDLKILQLLLQAGADPRAELACVVAGFHPPTALDLAAHTGHMGMVQALLAAGASARSEPGVPCSPAVIAAVHFGHADIVKVLLAAHPPVQPVQPEELEEVLLHCWRQGQGRKQQDVSAQLRLHLHKMAQWQAGAGAGGEFDPSSVIAGVVDDLKDFGTLVDGPAASLALLRGWSADVSEAEAAHRALSVQEHDVALGRAGAWQLLLLVAAAHKAHASKTAFDTHGAPVAAGCADEGAAAAAKTRRSRRCRH